VENKEKLNKIILAGNGFDLAHGLKTGYKHFIDAFWASEKDKIISTFDMNRFVYEDEYIAIKCPPALGFIDRIKQIRGFSFIEELERLLHKEEPHMTGEKFTLSYKNTFLRDISKKSHLKNWVDIEVEYYMALNKCREEKNGIENLNKDFFMIQAELEKYLTGQKITATICGMDELFNSIINSQDKDTSVNFNNSVLFLDFNYTNTLNFYAIDLQKRWKNEILYIQIHGELNNPKNRIIFGYGDEIDDNYQLIESENNNEYLENVKSIKYLETDNYQKLLTFIDSNEYEIYILGHSCGIADRTLLNTLFEHENCLSIKVYYHKKNETTDNYSDIIRNISRNFKDKPMMRKVVLNKPACKPLLQSNGNEAP